jgi:radical SAM protein with 4Fe4S-binding SPASM domain
MKYFLSGNAVLKRLEIPSVYNIKSDELYELDRDSFDFLKKCASETGCSNNDNKFTDYCLNEGILTEKKAILKRPPLIKSSFPSLRYLELQITDKCNLRCRHCYIGDKGSIELSSDSIRAILQEFEEMQGLRVLITGGEPLLHSRFHEINRMLPDFFIRKILFTNGLLLSNEILKCLNVHEIQISIDGLENAHDYLRGKGSFRSVMDAIRRSNDAGFEVSVSTMIHPKNLNDFDEMDELFNNIGIKDWTVDIPCLTGRLKENPDLYISPEQGGKYLKYGHEGGLHSGTSGYACGLHLMSVMSNGNVAKCTFYADKPVGTIEEGLAECWKRIKPIKLSELKCNCKHIEVCRGGCRYRAELAGDPLGKDLYRCFLHDIIKT